MDLTTKNMGDIIKNRRKQMGLSQVQLAQSAAVSLPTIQNLEAGKGNPGLNILDRVLGAIGLNFEIQHNPVDWGLLAAIGAPILQRCTKHHKLIFSLPSLDEITKTLKLAALEITAKSSDKQREKEALQALILALQSHYPSFYESRLKTAPVIQQIIPRLLTGRLIKLRRSALSILSHYL